MEKTSSSSTLNSELEAFACRANRCDISKLLPFFLDDDDENIVISPSRLNYELEMSTEERLERLCRPTRRLRIFTAHGSFCRTPDIVVFQNFQPVAICKASLTLQNMHKVSRHIQLVKELSPYFEITYSSGCKSKIAPGMTYTIYITFKPTEVRDYFYKIDVISDVETFSIPVYGVGHRPILKAPDQITLHPTAVRIPTKKSIILHNHGKVPALFVIQSEQAFSTDPIRGCIEANDHMEVAVICKPKNINTPLVGNIVFLYDDLKFTVTVECEVSEIEVHIKNNSIIFDETYIGLKDQKIVTVENRSEYTLHFHWKQNKTFTTDEVEKNKLIKSMEGVNEIEKKKTAKVEYMNIIDGEGHAKVLTRTLDEIALELHCDFRFPFKSETFSIIPMEGHILSKQSMDFVVVFSPEKNEYYNRVAYLEVTGRNDRLPLTLSGSGCGPQVNFNVKILDISNIFIQAIHDYHVVVKNFGHIPATVFFKEVPTEFGGKIDCVPKHVYLKNRDSCQGFIISFCSFVKGPFIERVQFGIQESNEEVYFVLKGNVVCPTLTSNLNVLDFGEVAYGTEVIENFSLINSSQVSIDFRIESKKMEQAKQDECKETKIKYEIDPVKGVVAPFSESTIKVIIPSLNAGVESDTIIVYMWGEQLYFLEIPVRFSIIPPTLKCDPLTVNIHFCFVGYDYRRVIKLVNTSNLHGKVLYTPAELPKGFSCTLNADSWEFSPYEEIEITLAIKANLIGLIEFPLLFTVEGDKPERLCIVSCNVQGAVISCFPDELQFGTIRLLEEVTKQLTIVNDSPIPAKLTLIPPKIVDFKLSHEKLLVGPESKVTVTAICLLVDVGKFKENISIKIDHGDEIFVTTSGEGVGYSISCSPNLVPVYNAGVLLTYQDFKLPVEMTNHGHRHYRVAWTTKLYQKLKHFKDDDQNISTVFEIIPTNFDLGYKETIKVLIRGYSKKPKIVEEKFYCLVMPEKSSKKIELLFSFTMRAEFIEPQISVSMHELHFMVTDEAEVCEMIDSRKDIDAMSGVAERSSKNKFVSVYNRSLVPVKISFHVTSDFYIKDDDGPLRVVDKEIPVGKGYEAGIVFVPEMYDKRYDMRKGKLTIDLVNHHKVETVSLTGEICFPTIKIPAEIDFGTIPIDSTSFKHVLIENKTFMPAVFSWELLEEEFEIEPLGDEEDRMTTKESVSSGQQDFLIMVHDDDPSVSEGRSRSEIALSKKSKGTSFVIDCEHPETDDHDENAMKKILQPIIGQYFEKEDTEFFSDLPRADVCSSEDMDINSIFSIEPYSGTLLPHECIFANVAFNPPPNVNVRAVALCHVESGESERLELRGASANVKYKFDKDKVDFKRKMFYEICEGKLTITNTGNASIDVSISCDEDTDFPDPGWLTVTPRNRNILSRKSFPFTVRYYPGLTGYFSKKFLVNIDYLEPVEIYVTGYAEFPQVSIALPRPEIHEKYEIAYRGIDSITTGYLKMLRGPSTSEQASYYGLPDDMSLETYKNFITQDWIVISDKYFYPSEVDIELAIERILLNQAMLKSLHQKNRFNIEDFVLPAYTVNIGYVVLYSSVCYTVHITNQTSTKIEVMLDKKIGHIPLECDDFQIEFGYKQLGIGKSTELFLVFKPTRRRYGLNDVKVENRFYLRLKQGGLIPINIQAVVTMPRLAFQCTTVNFGNILMGEASRRSIVMTNNGHLPSEWYIEVDKSCKQFFVIPSRARIEVGKTGLLNIFYIPTTRGPSSVVMNMKIVGNQKSVSLKASGCGLEPTLLVKETLLKFTPTLPFSSGNQRFFTIENVSSFPVQYCFPELDSEYEEGKLLVEIYLNYHNLDVVLMPSTVIPRKLHPIFHSNFHVLVNKLRENLMQERDEVETEEDPLSSFSVEELFTLLMKYIEMEKEENDTTKTEDITKDDNKLRIKVIDEVKDSRATIVEEEGIYIIFHGVPRPDHYKTVTKAEIKLKLPVYSVDRLIYEELLENKSESAKTLRNAIDGAFDEKRSLSQLATEDEYDFIERKVATILSMKMQHSKLLIKSDKNTDKSTQKDPTFMNISSSVYFNILQKSVQRLTKAGVIIESLESVFLKTTQIALHGLLYAFGNAKYIHLIVWSPSFKVHLQDREHEMGQLRKKKSLSISTTDANALKEEKALCEIFNNTLGEILFICETWDKATSSQFKAYNRYRLPSLTYRTNKSTPTRAPSPVKKSRLSVVSESVHLDSGIPVWVFNYKQSELLDEYYDLIANFIEMNQELVESFQALDEVKLCESSELYQVYQNVKRKPKNSKSVFDISYCGTPLTTSEMHISSKIEVRSGSVQTRRKRRKQVEKTVDVEDVTCKDLEMVKRATLQPNQVVRYKITFSPEETGLYTTYYSIEIVGLHLGYTVKCEALSEIPKIDFKPENVFCRVFDKSHDRSIYDNSVFVKADNTFFFGPILIGTSKSLPYKTTIQLKNTSSIQCAVTVAFPENSHFNCVPKQLKIEPGTIGELEISVKPMKKGIFTAEMNLTIKNNPKVYTVRFHTRAVPMDFNFFPKAINYEKVAVNYTAKRNLTLRNPTPVDLFWSFVNPGAVSQFLEFSQTSGTIKLYSVEDIELRYKPLTEEFLTKKMDIQVFDPNNSSHIAFYKDNITFSIESVEYIVDYNEVIDLGEIRGRTLHKFNFDLFNRSKCSVELLISILDSSFDKDDYYRKYFNLMTTSEILPPFHKPLPVHFTFECAKELELVGYPVFICKFVEPGMTQNIVRSFVVKVNVKVFLSKYELCPASDLYFGYQQFQTYKTLSLELRNVGRFPFAYTFTLAHDDFIKHKVKKEKESTTWMSSSSKKSQSSGRDKTRESIWANAIGFKMKGKKAILPSSLQISCFSMTPSSGELCPGHTVRIDAICYPQELGEFNERVYFHVSEPLKEYLHGKRIGLHVTGCEPLMNFKMLKDIFREQFFVRKIEHFKPPTYIFRNGSCVFDYVQKCLACFRQSLYHCKTTTCSGSSSSPGSSPAFNFMFQINPTTKYADGHCVYASTENTLYFLQVCINTVKTARIHLTNIGHVNALVKLRLTDLVQSKVRFLISHKELLMVPYSTEMISISFKPDSLARFVNTLEISYNASTNNVFAFHLSGESCIPQIALLKPVADEQSKASLVFPLTYLGELASEDIQIQNVGIIPCKVIMDISRNPNDSFILETCEDSINFLNLEENEFINCQKSTMVNLNPSEIANFKLKYQPRIAINIQFDLKVHIVNNPFDALNIVVSAESYENEICIKDLPAFMSGRTVCYSLDLGYTILNRLEKKTFTLTNTSKCHAYKFEIIRTDHLIILPRIGHLKAGTSKDIVATFLSKTPIAIKKAKLEVRFIRIEYVKGIPDGIPWDERQEMAVWKDFDPNNPVGSRGFPVKSPQKTFFQLAIEEAVTDRLSRNQEFTEALREKYLVDTPEPEITYLVPSWEVIPIFFTVAADYAAYRCDVKSINFPTTLVKEKSEKTFDVANDGLIILQIEWHFLIDIIHLRQESAAESVEFPENLGSFGSARTMSTISSESHSTDVHLPMQIEPQKTIIEPQSSKTFKVIFSPVIAANYAFTLVSNIQSLHPKNEEMNISVTGRSEVAKFYFEVEETDYMTRRPGNRNCPSEDIPNPKVIEFDAVGVGAIYENSLVLVNNYHHSVTYKIETTNRSKAFTPFTCKNPTGRIKSGKKHIVSFYFNPQTKENFEEFFLFSLEEEDFTESILLAGRCRHPSILFTESHVTMRPTVLGVDTSYVAMLRNDENIPLTFVVYPSSLLCSKHEQHLQVIPMNGILKPKSDEAIQLVYKATKVGTVNFTLKCLIEKVEFSATLDISATCLEVLSTVNYYHAGHTVVLSSEEENVIDFGHVLLRKKHSFKLRISNIGQTGLSYTWLFNKKSVDQVYLISVSNEEFIPSMSYGTSFIYVEPIKWGTLNNFKMVLQITHGNKYVLKVKAVSRPLYFRFSFRSYNFGYVLIQKKKSKHYTVNLKLTNMEKQPLMVENISDASRNLTMELMSKKVPPNSTLEIPIHFHPLRLGHHTINCLLSVDSRKYPIKITGEAVKVDVQLYQAKDKYIDLGKMHIGTVVKRVVELINKTPTSLTISLNSLPNLPSRRRPPEPIEQEIKVPDVRHVSQTSMRKEKKKLNTEQKESEKNEKVKEKAKLRGRFKSTSRSFIEDLETNSRVKDLVRVLPEDNFVMEPNKKYQFTVQFDASEPLTNFSEKIYYEVQDHVEPLFQIHGSCISAEFVLDRKIITFSNVVVGYHQKMSFLLKNTGDVSERFKCVLSEPSTSFTVSPEEGFIRERAQREIWVDFRPKAIECQFSNKLKICFNATPALELILIGNSKDLPPPKDLLTFVCPVRTSSKHQIELQNPTKTLWEVGAKVNNEVFFVPKQIDIAAESNGVLEIEYRPLKMTSNSPDEAMLTIEFPDGQLERYNLEGSTLPPLPAERVYLDMPCKTNHQHILFVQNTLNEKQCVSVRTELISPISTKSLFKAQGFDMIELFPNSTKEYKWKMYIINEGQYEFKVFFTNTETKEYIFFEVFINVTPRQPLHTFNFATLVREFAEDFLILTNPINIPVAFNVFSDLTQVLCEKIIILQPYSKCNHRIRFYSFESGQFNGILEAESEELGTFTYTVIADVKPPRVEQVVRFRTELGESTTNQINFKNVFPAPIELSAKFDSNLFSMDKVLQLQAGQEGKFSVTFEPVDIGIVQSRFILTSPQTGDYIYSLYAECIPSTPKGPIFVRPMGTAVINFTNPFTESKTFNYKVDRIFTVKTASEVVKQKKQTKIVIGLPQQVKSTDFPLTGKLSITCEDETKKDYKWVYYLQSE